MLAVTVCRSHQWSPFLSEPGILFSIPGCNDRERMTAQAVTGVTRNCDIGHNTKYMMDWGLRAGAAGVAITAVHRTQVAEVHGMLEGRSAN